MRGYMIKVKKKMESVPGLPLLHLVLGGAVQPRKRLCVRGSDSPTGIVKPSGDC